MVGLLSGQESTHVYVVQFKNSQMTFDMNFFTDYLHMRLTKDSWEKILTELYEH